jgi:hypothetical protein
MEFSLPGRVNNPYKEQPKIVEQPVHKDIQLPAAKSQGCVQALTAGYGTLEYCTQNGTPLPVPPRRVQFDTNVENIITRSKRNIFGKVKKMEQVDPIILIGGIGIIIWLLIRGMKQ